MTDAVDRDGIVSIGIVGAGEITRKAHLPVLLNMPRVRIAWLSDRRPERALSLAAAYGVPAVQSLAAEQLPACDVALLAIPVDARADYLRHFAATGTAVFCEKPFALTAADHRRILADFPPHMLACGFMRRFYRSTMLLRRIVDSQMFGPLLKIDVHEGNRSKGSGVDSSFLDDPTLGASRGVLMDLGSHSIDLALYIFNAVQFHVRSSARVLDGAVDRQVTATVELSSAAPNQTPVELNYGVSWLQQQTNRIHLQFERTAVWTELSVASGVYLGDPGLPAECLSLGSEAIGATTFNQAFYLEWCDFLDGMRAGRESRVSARGALLTTALVDELLAFNTTAHD